jgi:hypothetical protein
MGESRGTYGILVGTPEGTTEGRNHLENLGVDGRVALKWFFEKWDWVA